MQIIINLSEIEYRLITEKYPEELSSEFIERLFMKIEDGTALPENPKNGDMIKALFPCLEKYEYEELYTHGIALAGNDNRITWFANEWWNAPYKGGQDADND